MLWRSKKSLTSRKTKLANDVTKDQAQDQAQRSGSKNTCAASGLKLGSEQSSAPKKKTHLTEDEDEAESSQRFGDLKSH